MCFREMIHVDNQFDEAREKQIMRQAEIQVSTSRLILTKIGLSNMMLTLQQ